VLPDIPTVAEFVPGYEFSFWTGIGAPKNTPAAIVDKLNTEINAALADPKMKARLAELGATALPGSPADFGINSITGEDNIRWRDRRRCECRLKSAGRRRRDGEDCGLARKAWHVRVHPVLYRAQD
jgi:Tripartite tricarboxylate transporter family receptor